jgi:hypothetical protein
VALGYRLLLDAKKSYKVIEVTKQMIIELARAFPALSHSRIHKVCCADKLKMLEREIAGGA